MSSDDIKQALAARAEEFARWLLPNGRKQGLNWHIGSLDGEPGQSLAICITGAKAGVFKDFATDEAGDNLIELFAKSRHVPFKEALHACAEWLGAPLSSTSPSPWRAATSRPERTAGNGLPVPMSEPENEQARAMAIALSEDGALCEKIARSRKWRTQTIVELAQEFSLGWDVPQAGGPSGRLAFLYESGVKLRYRKENGDRVIWWAFGGPWLWRGWLLCGRSVVYLTEGETDAISLIDAGVETDATTCAVALPSASTFNQDWVRLFRGKEVILSFDNDQAGKEATKRVSMLLRPVAKSLRQLNWEGLQHAS